MTKQLSKKQKYAVIEDILKRAKIRIYDKNNKRDSQKMVIRVNIRPYGKDS